MTEEIDLDELDVASDDEETPNRGDWFWRGEGDPADEPSKSDDAPASVDHGSTDSASAGDTVEADNTASTSATETDNENADVSPGRVPHVPRENKDKPVGIPKESGGAGGVTAAEDNRDGSPTQYKDETEQTASGPHGGGVDDMTLALTYQAIKRVEEPLLAVRDAKGWTDWIGIVGDVDAHVINKFQRDHNIDVDFFSGSGQTAAGRLADIDKHSMFYAERMVVVGLPDERALAEQAGWEFVPLSDAAEKADWELAADDD